jgi:hypothetical protein
VRSEHRGAWMALAPACLRYFFVLLLGGTLGLSLIRD